MTSERVRHARIGKSRNQPNSASEIEPNTHLASRAPSSAQPSDISSKQFFSFCRNYDDPRESNKSLSGKREKRSSILDSVTSIRGLGCKSSSLPASAPSAIRSAAKWEHKQKGKKKKKKKQRTKTSNISSANVVPDVCCTPPGIGFVSDVAPRPRIQAQRTMNLQEPPQGHGARRSAITENVFAASDMNSHRSCLLEAPQYHHSHHRFTREIPQFVMFRRNLIPGAEVDEHDRYGDWRFDIGNMFYEELLDLGDRAGSVVTGLREDQIHFCLRKSKSSVPGFLPLLMSEWRCSICQEGYREDDDIRRLDCGHYHHFGCIKQWLLRKNACPVCKSAALSAKNNQDSSY